MTTGDWDFSSINWELDEAQYVSSPSSLSCLEDAGVLLLALVKTDTVPIANVEEGRVITSFRFTISGEDIAKMRVVFRYQDSSNFYYVRIRTTGVSPNAIIEIYRVKAGDSTLLDSLVVSVAKDVWVQWRVTWWNDYVGLVIRVDRYVSEAWEHQLDAYDSENNWEDIGGRVGIGLIRAGVVIHFIWADDTAIYGIS